MTLLIYQIFHTIAQEGSFQKAATLLNLTPSAVSHSIASFEKELGHSLFIRNKNGVSMTDYGKHLYPHIITVLNSNEDLKNAFSSMNASIQSNVKLGIPTDFPPNYISEIIKTYRTSHPNMHITILQGNYKEILDWLKTRTVHLGFLPECLCKDTSSFSSKPLYQEELVCATPKHFKPKHKNYISLQDIQEESFIALRGDQNPDIQNLFKQQEIAILAANHASDYISALSMVAAGLGLCIVPKTIIQHIDYDIDIYSFKPIEYKNIFICSLSKTSLSSGVKAMHSHIQKYFKDLFSVYSF